MENFVENVLKTCERKLKITGCAEQAITSSTIRDNQLSSRGGAHVRVSDA